MERTSIICTFCGAAWLRRYRAYGTPYFWCPTCWCHFEAVLRPGTIFKREDAHAR